LTCYAVVDPVPVVAVVLVLDVLVALVELPLGS
jgi:hypothetical protein